MTGLAGWLFADLLLVLFITAFASTTVPSAPPKPTAPASVHPAPKPTTSHQPVLILRPVAFTLPVPQPGIVGSKGDSSADLALVGELKSALQAKGLGNTRAGLVEAFGWSPTSDGDGIQVAQAANLAVAMNLPLFAQAYQQNFWTSGAEGTVTLKVFFFAHSN